MCDGGMPESGSADDDAGVVVAAAARRHRARSAGSSASTQPEQRHEERQRHARRLRVLAVKKAGAGDDDREAQQRHRPAERRERRRKRRRRRRRRRRCITETRGAAGESEYSRSPPLITSLMAMEEKGVPIASGNCVCCGPSFRRARCRVVVMLFGGRRPRRPADVHLALTRLAAGSARSRKSAVLLRCRPLRRARR